MSVQERLLELRSGVCEGGCQSAPECIDKTAHSIASLFFFKSCNNYFVLICNRSEFRLQCIPLRFRGCISALKHMPNYIFRLVILDQATLTATVNRSVYYSCVRLSLHLALNPIVQTYLSLMVYSWVLRTLMKFQQYVLLFCSYLDTTIRVLAPVTVGLAY